MATAGRKPLTPATSHLPELVPDAGAKMLAVSNSVHDIEKDEVLAAGIDLGRLEAMDFVLTISSAAMLSIYENVKKSKAWRHLRNPQSADGSAFLSLEEFCEVKLGKSYARVRELASNRKHLGEHAFEQAERLGLRQVDYNAIKGLPAPEQEMIRRAVEDGATKDEVLATLQELAGRFAKEKEALVAQAEDLKADAAAHDEVLAKRNARIDTLERQAKRVAQLPPDEKLVLAQKDCTDAMNLAAGAVEGVMRKAFQGLKDLGRDGAENNLFMAGLVAQVQATVNALRAEFRLAEVADGTAANPEVSAALREGLATLRASKDGAVQ